VRCNLGYSTRGDAIVAHINEHKTIFGAPHFKADHLPVFAARWATTHRVPGPR